MIYERYFAELSDSEDGQPIYFDNQVIDASNDQEAIGKADKWAARHKLGVVAMLIVRQGVRDVHSRKIYLAARALLAPRWRGAMYPSFRMAFSGRNCARHY